MSVQQRDVPLMRHIACILRSIFGELSERPHIATGLHRISHEEKNMSFHSLLEACSALEQCRMCDEQHLCSLAHNSRRLETHREVQVVSEKLSGVDPSTVPTENRT